MSLPSLARINVGLIHCDSGYAKSGSQIFMCIVHLSSSNFNSPVSPPSLAMTNVGWIHSGCAESGSPIFMCIVQLSGSNFNSTVSPPSLDRTNVGWIH